MIFKIITEEIIKEDLKQFTKNELFDFIDNYSKRDSKFANAVRVHFLEPDFDSDLENIKYGERTAH